MKRKNTSITSSLLVNVASYQEESKVESLIQSIATYCSSHQLYDFNIVFQGEEPWQNSVAFFKTFIKMANNRLSPKIKLAYSLQVNDIILTKAFCSALAALGIRLDISIDLNQSPVERYAQLCNLQSSLEDFILPENKDSCLFTIEGVLSMNDDTLLTFSRST